MDNQRGTPVGASDDESLNRSAASTPHSIVQIPDEPVNMYDNTSLKRNDSLQSKFDLLNIKLIWVFVLQFVENIIIYSPGGQASRKAFKSIDQTPLLNFDHDENKYKQKSTFAWISRWWK